MTDPRDNIELVAVANDGDDSDNELQNIVIENRTIRSATESSTPLLLSVAIGGREVTRVTGPVQNHAAPNDLKSEDGTNTQMQRRKSLDTLYESCQVHPVVRVNSLRTLAPPIQRDDTQTEKPIGSYIQRLNTQLLNAVEKNDITEIDRLLKEGASPNATCRRRHVSACHVAALRGGAALARLLAAGGALRPDRAGATPLHLAAWAGNHHIITILLNYPEVLQSIQDNTDEAVGDTVEELLPDKWLDGITHSCDDLEKQIPSMDAKWSPLHAASFSAHALCVQLLLDAGANSNAKDENGYIPLEVVGHRIYSGHVVNIEEFLKTIEILVNAGSRIDVAPKQGEKTYLPLHTAVEVGSVDAIRLLLEAGATSTVNKEGLTPMHLCVKNQLKEHLKVLAQHDYVNNGSAIDIQDSKGLTVLHEAARARWTPGLSIALAFGANITIKAKNGKTALHDAAANNNLDVLNILLEFAKIRDVIDCPNENNETALFRAVSKGHIECVQRLLKDGASMIQKLPPQEENINILHKAAEKGHLNILKFLIKNYLEDIKPIINSLAMLKKYKKPRTPLHLAVANNHSECVKLLLSNREVLNMKIDDVYTPMICAVVQNNTEIVETIIKCDKSLVNSSNGKSYPLHYACRHSSKECIKLLLREGADLSKTNANKLTPIELIVDSMKKPKQFIEDIFDSCIKSVTIRKYSGFEIDYSILMPNETAEQMKVVQALCDNGNMYNEKKLLVHPLIESFLYLKWKALVPFYYAIILIWSLFVISFTIQGMSYFSYININDVPILMNKTFWSCIVLTLGGFLLLLEGLMIWNVKNTTHFDHVETWLKVFTISLDLMISLAIALGEPNRERFGHLFAFAIVISWIQIMFLFSRFPDWGYSFLIFGRVTCKILKIFLSFIFLLVGFALAFMIEFRFQKPFDNFCSAIFKTIVMLTSEFDYSNLFEKRNTMEFSTIFLQLTFVVYIIFIAIVLMNLMVGVAVDDVRNLKLLGNIDRIEKQIDLLSILELLVNNSILGKILPSHLIKALKKKACIDKSIEFTQWRNPYDFPRHIINALIKNKTNEEDSDTEVCKTQINEIHKAVMDLKELHERKCKKSATADEANVNE